MDTLCKDLALFESRNIMLGVTMLMLQFGDSIYAGRELHALNWNGSVYWRTDVLSGDFVSELTLSAGLDH